MEVVIMPFEILHFRGSDEIIKSKNMENDIKLAVLIDGDNIPSAYVKEMMEEITKYGNPTIKRIYGDWTKPHLSKWKNLLLEVL